jgi:hypothetical protein
MMRFARSVVALTAALLAQQPCPTYGLVPSSPSSNARTTTQHNHALLHASTTLEVTTSSSSAEQADELEESVEFPPPLTSFDRFKRAATFWSTAIPIVANYYGLMSNLKLQEMLGDEQKEADIEVSPTSIHRPVGYPT